MNEIFLQADLVDVIGINRYVGWYDNIGHLETIKPSLTYHLRQFAQKFKKPILQTEYGAGAIAGLHAVVIFY